MLNKIYYALLFLLYFQIHPLQAQIMAKIPIQEDLFGKRVKVTGYFLSEDTALTKKKVRLGAYQMGEKFKYDKKQQYEIDDIENSPWKRITLDFKIKPNSDTLLIMLFSKVDYFNIDAFSMKYKQKDKWTEYPLFNSSFENLEVHKPLKGWSLPLHFPCKVDTLNTYDGKKSLKIKVPDLERYGDFSSHAETVHVNGVEIYYETYGEGEPLLLLHGNNQSIGAMSKQIDYFRDKYRVIAVDSRGQGHSSMDKRKMSYTLMAEDMNALLDKIQVDSVHLVGWSDGGNTGLIMAMNYPDKIKSLTTMGANLYLKKGVVEKKFIRNVKLEIRIVGVIAFFNPKQWKEKYRVAKMLLKYPNINPEDLKGVQAPVMVVAGENDLIMPDHTKLIAESIPNSKLVIIEGADHYAPSDDHEKFNQYVLDFLSKEKKEMK